MKLVVEFFDMTLEQISREIENAHNNNVKWILIPPQQEKLNYENEWWSSYRPLGYTISENNKEKLIKLVQLCENYQIDIIVDIVLNHTDRSVYENKKNFYNEGGSFEITKQWLYELPDWNTLDPKVKQSGKDIIQEYRNMGIKGFRFDAAPYIDHEFFDFILENSPSNEIHLYEVFGFDLNFVNSYLKRRIEFREANTFLYDFQEFYNSNRLINQENVTDYDSFYYDTIIPKYGFGMITNHDQILHNFDIKPSDMFSAGILTTFMTCHEYLLTVFCATSSIPLCALWSWDSIKRYINPIIQLRNDLGDNGKIPCNLQSYGPILVGLRSPNVAYLYNRNYTSDKSQVPVDFIEKDFIGFKNDVLTNIVNGNVYSTDKIPVPQKSVVICKKDEHQYKSNVFIHQFWYQGWENVPDFVTKSREQWSSLCSKTCLKLWDKHSIEQLSLSEKERDLLEKIENAFPVPEKYAAYSDIARLIVLSRYCGIYVDTDSYPSESSHLLIEWVRGNSNSIIFGREPSGLINNAIILCSENSRKNAQYILDKIIDEQNEYFDINVLNFAGPQRLTTVMRNMKWYNQTILPVNWLYSTWMVEKNGVHENCTKEIVLAQHCYAGSWTNSKNGKYFNDITLEYFKINKSKKYLYISLVIVVLVFLIYFFY